MKLFSVITVTYNAAEVLERTLLSVGQQTCRDFEHLIVDGASTDGTLALAARYGHATVCSEPDRGLYDAMNKGVAKARGRYVIFLNAGDTFHSADTLAQVAAALAPSEGSDEWPTVLYGETDVVDLLGNFVRHRRLQAPEALTWRDFRHGMLVCHQSFYVRTDVAQRHPYDWQRYRLSADYEWCIRVMKEPGTILNTHQILTNYLEGGLSVKNHRRSLVERMKAMAVHYGWPVTLVQHVWFVMRALIKQ